MTRCILYKWLVKVLKLKRCMNCRFYACGACIWARTAQPKGEFQTCCHFSLEGYYKRYKEFLEKVIKYVDEHNAFDSRNYIKSLQKKYLIDEFKLSLEPRYIRLWFKMEGENHYCHFMSSWYELDANVQLDVNRKRRRT